MPLDLELVRNGPDRLQRRQAGGEAPPDWSALGAGVWVIALLLALIGALTAIIRWFS
jgi:hypothetical protein